MARGLEQKCGEMKQNVEECQKKKTQKERGNITREKIRGNDKKDMEKKSSDRTQKRHF